MNHKQNTRNLVRISVIAALYVVLTLVSASFGLAYGPIQLRLSETLCILPMLTPVAIPGLTIGCVIANFFSPFGIGMIFDMIVGSIATLLGALGAAMLKKHPYLAPLPTVLFNAFLVPLVIIFAYGAEESYLFLVLTVGAGEFLSAYLLGLVLYTALGRIQKNRNQAL